MKPNHKNQRSGQNELVTKHWNFNGMVQYVMYRNKEKFISSNSMFDKSIWYQGEERCTAMRKTKVILFTIFGTTVGLVASVFALVVKSVTIDILKGYSLEWIVDVVIAVIFGIVIFRYIQKKFKSRNK